MANAVGKEYSEAKRAYLAGFLDADGAIMATIERHQEKKFRQDLLKVARFADALARLNVRSKNRRKNYMSMIKEYFSSND